jgi:hypothetical protein
MNVPDRATHPNRAQGDYTNLHDGLHLNPNMRTSGTSITTQARDSKTGGYGQPSSTAMYETGSHKHVGLVMDGTAANLKNQGGGHIMHTEVTYNHDDVAAERTKVAKEIAKKPQYSDSSHALYEHSGVSRQMQINAEAERAVPTRAGTSTKIKP